MTCDRKHWRHMTKGPEKSQKVAQKLCFFLLKSTKKCRIVSLKKKAGYHIIAKSESVSPVFAIFICMFLF